ncbi:flagellar protein FlgN [Virgibacillus soli]|uniref:Flagellar protein FlgN n=1 Tax=Paracerasibacillus soli TaxID=480284 RepID=A0ABU5CRB6_9BACI|nr:flagellar protein FlgN [Virgibacillus soli]MDY0408919.1 flagellar protein FlgN [Virgibacillus soli]
MTIQLIVENLAQLCELHQKLLAISVEKTEVIKTNKVDHLQALVLKERKVVQDLGKAEQERKQLVETWFSDQSLSVEEATVTNMLPYIKSETEQAELERITIALTEIIVKLKQQENLNEQLIHQSMQFVQVSLDLINPTVKNVNYGKKENAQTANRTLFDSKA